MEWARGWRMYGECSRDLLLFRPIISIINNLKTCFPTNHNTKSFDIIQSRAFFSYYFSTSISFLLYATFLSHHTRSQQAEAHIQLAQQVSNSLHICLLFVLLFLLCCIYIATQKVCKGSDNYSQFHHERSLQQPALWWVLLLNWWLNFPLSVIWGWLLWRIIMQLVW
jgi:cytochrome bd-type quinol oxidase subunit 2